MTLSDTDRGTLPTPAQTCLLARLSPDFRGCCRKIWAGLSSGSPLFLPRSFARCPRPMPRPSVQTHGHAPGRCGRSRLKILMVSGSVAHLHASLQGLCPAQSDGLAMNPRRPILMLGEDFSPRRHDTIAMISSSRPATSTAPLRWDDLEPSDPLDGSNSVKGQNFLDQKSPITPRRCCRPPLASAR